MAEERTHIRKCAQGLAALALLMLTDCGNQAFVAQSTANAQVAPGTYTVPAKVDILLAEDDTGSMLNFAPQLKPQFSSFMTALQSSGWDYHFATVPLTHTTLPPQILASQYDSNWGSQWIQPYPGAPNGGPGTILSSFFSLPENYNGYLWAASYASNAGNGEEPGVANIVANVSTLNGSNTNFLRNDALLVVIALSTGEDTSGRNLSCTNQNGQFVPCDGNPVDSDYDLSTYEQTLVSIKGQASAIRFYAGVSEFETTGCLGVPGQAYAGVRYEDVASYFQGGSVDICSAQLSGLVASLSSDLQAVRQSMETRYLSSPVRPTFQRSS